MAKLELDLSSNELEELSTASFKEQDKAQEIKKTGGRPKSANPANKRTTMFLSSDELAFLDEMGYLTRTNRTQYLRSIIREKMESINKGAV
ncbi:hypothetical protein [Campylobacter sp. CCUG 57310]|uniref:hypothetical protein n=1 Tax=Campylobacter sp. CCUG 57310 TaxID=2517362 RepID=UPI00156620CD|nr:hypothetical protein [Campylobacter sp. CCUG 57310]QKF93242.1 hypothetical protein CORI_b007 [Campylobacter sp. CCUG 57310]